MTDNLFQVRAGLGYKICIPHRYAEEVLKNSENAKAREVSINMSLAAQVSFVLMLTITASTDSDGTARVLHPHPRIRKHESWHPY